MNVEFEALSHGGFTFRMPAGPGGLFTEEAAASLVGTYTNFQSSEGDDVEHSWRMKVVAAELEDDGKAILVTFRPPEIGDEG